MTLSKENNEKKNILDFFFSGWYKLHNWFIFIYDTVSKINNDEEKISSWRKSFFFENIKTDIT